MIINPSDSLPVGYKTHTITELRFPAYIPSLDFSYRLIFFFFFYVKKSKSFMIINYTSCMP